MKKSKAEMALIKQQKKEEQFQEQAKRDGFSNELREKIKFHMEQLSSVESRLDFLTDIFSLTEDLRHEISWQTSELEFDFNSGVPESCENTEQMQSDRKENLQDTTLPFENGNSDRPKGSVNDTAPTSDPKFEQYLKTYTLVAALKADPYCKVIYKYITKHRIKFIDTKSGQIGEMHQFTFFKKYQAQKKTNRKNKKRNFMNYGRKRVA